MSSIRGRLAPSPTGALHVGNVRTLMLAWLSARAAGGAVILRVEDIDRARCKPGYAERMLDDLRWLGFDWDEGPDVGGPHAPYIQFERIPRYRAALDRLRALGLAYPCVCSRADIAIAASAPHGPEATTYPGTCRDRFADADDARRASGRDPAWRFDSRSVSSLPWQDALRPSVRYPDAVDDFVLWRADGVPSYQLAVVVDDRDMEVTDVVRGDDLADSTPRQLALLRALGGVPPTYRHVPLVIDEEGRRLAKRTGATAVAELRRLGLPPERLAGFLARGLGLTDSAALFSLHDLVPSFSWDRVNLDPVRIAEAELRSLSVTGA